MSALNQFDMLFRTGIQLVRGVSGRWQIKLFNPDSGQLEPLSSGLALTSLLQLPADPPDFVTVNGETIIVEGR